MMVMKKISEYSIFRVPMKNAYSFITFIVILVVMFRIISDGELELQWLVSQISMSIFTTHKKTVMIYTNKSFNLGDKAPR